MYSIYNTSLSRAVCMVFSTWLAEYPEDFQTLGDPTCLLHLAPLLPSDTSTGADLCARILRIAEELSEKALLADPRSCKHHGRHHQRGFTMCQTEKGGRDNKHSEAAS